MFLDEVMSKLEAAGTAQNRKVYERHGVRPPAFGVSYATQGALKKAIKTDHPLAVGLWATGNHDARILATMVADPARMDEATLDRWTGDLANYVLTDALAKLAASAPVALTVMRRWMTSREEWVAAAGWTILAIRAGDSALSEADLRGDLATIEREIAGRPNRVRYAMNNALIAIGLRDEALREEAIATALRIGKVVVDHGETGCKTPDAAQYIRKAAARPKRANSARKGKAQSK